MLKKTLAALALGSALLSAGHAMAADYAIDKQGQHAFVNFKISHLGYSWLYGTFKDFDGSFSFDDKNPEASKVNVTLNTQSVDTNNAERDKHIRSGDFLNVGKHPTATFASTAVKTTGEGTADITGNLTLNGVTKPVVIAATFIGQGDDPWGGAELHMSHGTVKTHVSHLLTKLRCRDRAQLVMVAYETGAAVPGEQLGT
jgi:polyisoprenoid-binding protein YceI